MDVVDQKRENLLNLALSASEEERLKSENLEIGYDPEDKTWELILRYSGNLNRLRELSDQGVTVRELFNGYAIARVPQGLLDQVSGIREIQYIENQRGCSLPWIWQRQPLVFGDSAGEKRGRQVIWNRAGRTYRWPGAWAYGKRGDPGNH